MLINIVIFLVTSLMLSFFCTNLIGFIVRNLINIINFLNLKRSKDKTLIYLKDSIQINRIIFIFITSIVITLIFFICLLHFTNFGIFLSGLLMMIFRLPDLLIEIKAGEKLSNSEKRKIQGNFIFFVLTVLSWSPLILIYMSLYGGWFQV